jgi:hypothetical protein
VAARQAHNLEVAGSNPAPATIMISAVALFLLRLSKSGYNFLVFLTVREYGSKNSKNSISDFETLATKPATTKIIFEYFLN